MLRERRRVASGSVAGVRTRASQPPLLPERAAKRGHTDACKAHRRSRHRLSQQNRHRLPVRRSAQVCLLSGWNRLPAPARSMRAYDPGETVAGSSDGSGTLQAPVANRPPSMSPDRQGIVAARARMLTPEAGWLPGGCSRRTPVSPPPRSRDASGTRVGGFRSCRRRPKGCASCPSRLSPRRRDR